MFERDVTFAATLIVPHGVTMEERAAPAVLTGDANFIAFSKQRRVRERLSKTPVERHLTRDHLFAALHDVRDLSMQHEVRWERGELFTELTQLLDAHTGRNRFGPIGTLILAPVHGMFVADHAERVLHGRFAFIERAS